MLQKLGARKGWNAARLYTGYHLSRWFKRPIQFGMPMAASIEPTTACNLGCPECPSGLREFTRATGTIDREKGEKTIDAVAKHAFYLTFYFQGEPYINPNFLNLVNYASNKGLYTATSTNAHFLTPEVAEQTVRSGLDRMIISVDGTSQEVYEQYRRRGSLDKVLEGTKNIIEAKKRLKSATPFVIFQFLVVKPNEHQVPDIEQMAKDYEVDELRLKTAQIYDYKKGSPLIPENEAYSRYARQPDGTYKFKGKMQNQCWRMWHSCVVTWDGDVVPCCFDKDATHVMGNIHDQSIKQIWRSPEYKSFRQNVLRSRKNIDICSNCSEGTKVWAES